VRRVALLDVNVLVALFDPDHVHHEPAHAWFGAHRRAGWATCPLTENALVRILSNPGYGEVPCRPDDIASRLARFERTAGHELWADDVSLVDARLFRLEITSGHRQITDAYLLGLARRHDGRLATFDRSIPLACVRGATPDHLTVIPA
jgi:toxin-antitoxin system PIN domain toxin